MAITLAHTLEEARRQSRGDSLQSYAQPWTTEKRIRDQFYGSPSSAPSPTLSGFNPLKNDTSSVIRQDIEALHATRPTQAINDYCADQQLHQSDDSSTAIIPDLLPPHSNPHTLSRAQTDAYQSSDCIPPVRITHDAVIAAQTGMILFTISRPSTSLISSIRSKPNVILLRPSSSTPMGQIRFHHSITSTSAAVDLTLSDRHTTLSRSGLLRGDRWSFESAMSSNIRRKIRYYWCSDASSGTGVQLQDRKKGGRVVARLEGDVLSCQMARLESEGWEEMLLSAIAMMEAARRWRKGKGMGTGGQDVGRAVAEFIG